MKNIIISSKSKRKLKIIFQAYSVSETLSLLDYGTNYCNLFNLMDGSGLVNDPDFTEDTNNFICTQVVISSHIKTEDLKDLST